MAHYQDVVKGLGVPFVLELGNLLAFSVKVLFKLLDGLRRSFEWLFHLCHELLEPMTLLATSFYQIDNG